MKKLIFPLITLISFNSFADLGGEMGPLSDANLKKKFVTEVKELEVDRIMKGTKEFQKCREKNKFEMTSDLAKKDDQLQKATDCFNQELKGVKGDQLVELSKKLELESYGIVKSKNAAEISKYLSKKMAKALTGYDPDDLSTRKESLKWKNVKILDQKMFLEIYQTQLAKNAMLEVSRFCIQNLRKPSAPATGTDFQSYWGPSASWPDSSTLVDNANDSFLDVKPDQDLSKPEEVYKSIQSSISNAGVSADIMEKFFGYCSKTIKILCEKFKNDVKNSAAAKNQTTPDASQIGANSCLSLNRLQSLRVAITQTDKVAKEMEKLNSQEEKFSLVMDANVFVPGQNGAASIDELTSATGYDAIAGAQDDKDYEEKVKKCEKDRNDSDCEGYLQDGEAFYKAIHSTEMEMNLKREVTRRQIQELMEKNDKQKVQDWLKENGYIELAAEYEKDPNSVNLEEAITNLFDARKTAEIQALKSKVGKRQIKDEDGKEKTGLDTQIGLAMKDSREERIRLAQVVTFNNIISSYLTIGKKKADGSIEKMGRNVTGLRMETMAMENAKMKSTPFFDNLQDTVKQEDKGATKEATIDGLNVIDMVLGVPKKGDE